MSQPFVTYLSSVLWSGRSAEDSTNWFLTRKSIMVWRWKGKWKSLLQKDAASFVFWGKERAFSQVQTTYILFSRVRGGAAFLWSRNQNKAGVLWYVGSWQFMKTTPWIKTQTEVEEKLLVIVTLCWWIASGLNGVYWSQHCLMFTVWPAFSKSWYKIQAAPFP